MKNKIFTGDTIVIRLPEGPFYEISGIVSPYTAGDDSTRKEVYNYTDIIIDFLVLELRDITDPDLIRSVSLEDLINVILVFSKLFLVEVIRINADAYQIHFSHQLSDKMNAYCYVLLP